MAYGNGRATREALLSEAGFEKLFRTQNWVRRSKLFCRWFCFLLGQAGCISVAAWTQLKDVEGSFLWFRFVWWLDCLLLKEGASAFCSLRWLLEVFLAVAEFVGFRAGSRLPFEWLYWILYCPLLAPLAPLDSYRSFRPRKNMNYDFFQSIPLLINSINFKTGWSKNLLRERCGKVKYWRLSYSAIVSISCQLHWVIELKHTTE